jgi:integrase
MIAMEDFEYLSREKNRHGKEVLYVRRNGKRIRIREKEGTEAFAKAYVAALEKLGGSKVATSASVLGDHPKGSFGWLATLYFKGRGEGEFQTLDKDSQRARRNDLERCFQVSLDDEHPNHKMGDCPLKHFSAQKAKRMIEAIDGPGARTNRRKHLSALCAWAVDQKPPLLPSNPVRDVKAGRRIKGGGYYTWTIEDVKQFIDYHTLQGQTNPKKAIALRSRKAVLALGLLLFSGARRQDMVTFGKQHIKGDWLQYVPKKTLKQRREVSQKPLLPVLRQIIANSPCGKLTFLQTEYGKPFVEAGFGNWFRDRCDEAGLPLCTAHGLKKAGATIAAENGATTRQLMAMFDWTTPAMAEVYTRKAEQKRLAGEAMFLITLDRRTETERAQQLSHLFSGAVAPEKKAQ